MKKGFTLIELLVTIIILSIILLIAVPSINNISNSIMNSEHENVIKNIEIAAEKYAFDTYKEYVLVDTLIKEGYLRSDDGDDLIDPLDNKKLNCYLVKVEKISDYYKAHFSDDIYEKEGMCDTTILDNINSNVVIKVYNNNEEVEDYQDWLKGDISLEAKSDNIEIDCQKYDCLWQNNRGLESKDAKITIPNNHNVINTVYNFQITIKDNEEVYHYKNSINLKIDNESPKVLVDNIKIPNEYIATAEKNITVVASDGLGSGIKGYYITNDLNYDCASANYFENNTFKITSSGEYLICVIDKVGNIGSDKINISNITT